MITLSRSLIGRNTSNNPYHENPVSMTDVVDMSLNDFIELVNNDSKKIDVKKLTDAIAEDKKRVEYNLPLQQKFNRRDKAYRYLFKKFDDSFCKNRTADEFIECLEKTTQINDYNLTSFEKNDDECMKDYADNIASFKRVMFSAIDSYVLNPYEKKKGKAVTRNLRQHAFSAVNNLVKELDISSENPKILESHKVFNELMCDLTSEKEVA